MQEAENQLKIYKQEAQEKSDLTQAYAKSDFADQKLAAGDTQQAIALYREALAANPRDASFAYKFAMALEKTGDTENERLALEQADPDQPGPRGGAKPVGIFGIARGRRSFRRRAFPVGRARFSWLRESLGESGGDFLSGIQVAGGEASSRARVAVGSGQSAGSEIAQHHEFPADTELSSKLQRVAAKLRLVWIFFAGSNDSYEMICELRMHFGDIGFRHVAAGAVGCRHRANRWRSATARRFVSSRSMARQASLVIGARVVNQRLVRIVTRDAG